MLISLVPTTQHVDISAFKITPSSPWMPMVGRRGSCDLFMLPLCLSASLQHTVHYAVLYFPSNCFFLQIYRPFLCLLICVLSLPITHAEQFSFVSTAVSTPFSQCLLLLASFFPLPPLSPLPLLSPWSSPLVQPSREAGEGKEC